MTRYLVPLVSMFGLMACGVNELPQYRGQIHSATVETRVADLAELDVADSPVAPVPGTETPSDLANAASEDYILSAFAQRMQRSLSPDTLASAMGETFADDLARGTAWRITGPRDAFDLRVLAEVEGYGVSVDELGRASVYFRMKTSAWFESTGALVYQTWQNHEAPLMTYYGYYDPTDPADVAAERAVNLIELGQVSGAELRARVADMASEAGAKLARQMVDDSRM
ncbi:MAG: hypothetical protein KC635_02425 [Myxococcales bacterium]|nr:hypothetical protein [Myxococcales bacterium]MCB9731096.1 hypothetical protein [Deltaproteobacteria bacterium]